jgi:hypothetical protein
MKFDIYTMATEPTSTAYYINPSHQSVCLYLYPKSYQGNEYTRDNRIIVVVFYEVRVVLKKAGD